ncbi:MAG: HAMP domain-containing protein, partial [Acidobacteria bacterium]|nr:HAMP domain-containing protein [Acidobacteriota bacterium]
VAGGAALLLWILRGFGLALLAGTVVPPRFSPAAVAFGAVVALVALAAAAEASPIELAILTAGLALLAVGWLAGRSGESGRARALLGALGPPALFAAACLLPLAPLGDRLFGSAGEAMQRLALLGVALGFALAGAGRAHRSAPDRYIFWSVATALLAAATADAPVLSLAAGAGAATLLAFWLDAERLQRPLALGAAALVAALLAGAAWTGGVRERGRLDASERVSALLPPADSALDALELEVAGDLSRRLAGAGGEIAISERSDLAFSLWRRSPLARADLLSAVVVATPNGPLSTFSYGLPLTEGGDLDEAPVRWLDSVPAAWRARLRTGRLEGARGERVAWWLVPRPGFGLAPSPLGDLAAGLLRGGPASHRLAGLPDDASWVAYDADGRVAATAWKEGTPPLALLRTLAPGGHGKVSTPEGRAEFVLAEGGEGAVALFLEPLPPPLALERASVVAVGGLAIAAAIALVALAAGLPRSAVRDLARRTIRSYSRRLVLVLTVLLLVPMALLYALLSESLGRRIAAEQRTGAEAALASVQRILGEYVLSLEPGFGVGTAIDDELLVWLSRVVRHEVHLYWGSEVYASSKRDLFSSGLLPRRVPGVVWERIALAGESLAARTSRAAGSEFVELYAPLEVPGRPSARSRLLLGMPLLAQQEEALAETARIRRRALLATIALFLALAATAQRLATRFTRPIEEMVEGTRRIAAGASRLEARPNELELDALATAIDRMAARIAEGRERLLAEKHLIETIVEHVTAGVVCLDRDGAVLMANQVARQLLAVEPGQLLLPAITADARLAPVADFLEHGVEGGGHAAVRLGGDGSERDWTLVRVPLEGAGEPAELFVVEDVTEVTRGQRLEAWASMARIIAHEIKNPLTPIRLSAEHLREAWSRDRQHFESVFERCTTNILRQVEDLREIASEFSTYSHIPRIDPQPGDLAAMAREVVEAYRAAPPPGVSVRFDAEADPLLARFDARLLGRALRNLLENALRASVHRGTVEVRVFRERGRGAIAVADSGPGVPAEQLGRIFEPYFSTHSGGTGLGLPIARRIAEEHGGTLTAHNRATGGLEAVIAIPLG